jgi:hypothetical protein
MPKHKLQVFAIIRIDAEPPPGSPPSGPGIDLAALQNRSIRELAVTSIVPSSEEAIREVDRLNRLNDSKGARYYWMATRYFPEGKSRGE